MYRGSVKMEGGGNRGSYERKWKWARESRGSVAVDGLTKGQI